MTRRDATRVADGTKVCETVLDETASIDFPEASYFVKEERARLDTRKFAPLFRPTGVVEPEATATE